jgi:hypothetical protein
MTEHDSRANHARYLPSTLVGTSFPSNASRPSLPLSRFAKSRYARQGEESVRRDIAGSLVVVRSTTCVSIEGADSTAERWRGTGTSPHNETKPRGARVVYQKRPPGFKIENP